MGEGDECGRSHTRRPLAAGGGVPTEGRRGDRTDEWVELCSCRCCAATPSIDHSRISRCRGTPNPPPTIERSNSSDGVDRDKPCWCINRLATQQLTCVHTINRFPLRVTAPVTAPDDVAAGGNGCASARGCETDWEGEERGEAVAEEC